ncbi:hypothetical protein BMS3Abin09_01043 [bacterium BMS3Abin09]|nr:hypothetical protein BMS3Abin09_01043 [bacterium BMS3Abin09]
MGKGLTQPRGSMIFLIIVLRLPIPELFTFIFERLINNYACGRKSPVHCSREYYRFKCRAGLPSRGDRPVKLALTKVIPADYRPYIAGGRFNGNHRTLHKRFLFKLENRLFPAYLFYPYINNIPFFQNRSKLEVFVSFY